MNTIAFRRDPAGEGRGGVELTVDGKHVPLEPSLEIRRHSPTGFEFGYGGSGPAQAALAILLHVLGKRNADTFLPGGDAERLYQAFKWEFVGRLPNTARYAEFTLDVKAWATAQLTPSAEALA